jgi:hypothetical protein
MNKVKNTLNSYEIAKYKASFEGVDVDKYIDDCVVGGQKYLLKQRDPNDYVKGRRLLKMVTALNFVNERNNN